MPWRRSKQTYAHVSLGQLNHRPCCTRTWRTSNALFLDAGSFGVSSRILGSDTRVAGSPRVQPIWGAPLGSDLAGLKRWSSHGHVRSLKPQRPTAPRPASVRWPHCVKVPVGAVGPLRIHGATGIRDYYVPLATTEATLVASYGRGARLISTAGGCTVATTHERVSRAPGFIFASITEAHQFAVWAADRRDQSSHAARVVANGDRGEPPLPRAGLPDWRRCRTEHGNHRHPGDSSARP